MKNIIYKGLAGSLILLGLNSCELRDELRGRNGLEENEGYMELSLETKSRGMIIASTKALVDGTFNVEDVNPENYTLNVINAETGGEVTVITYKNLKAQGGKLPLAEGKYSVKAYNYDGAEVNASIKPYFSGTCNFQIKPGGNTVVNTSCTLQNIEVGMELATDFQSSFKDDYTITISNGESGNWIFNKDNIGKKVYFKVPESPVNFLNATIKATTLQGDAIVAQATISKPTDAEGETALKAGDSFVVTLNPGSDPVTKYNLSISVDLTMNETGETIEIPTENIVYNENQTPPSEEGVSFKGLPANYTLEEATTRAIVEINAPRGIRNLLVKINSDNVSFNATIAGFGLGEEFDLANPGELLPVLSQSLELGEGIGLIDAGDPILGKTNYTFDVREFMGLLGLYGSGVYTFSIRVNDDTEVQSGDLVVTAE